jgi:hypothetical protein
MEYHEPVRDLEPVSTRTLNSRQNGARSQGPVTEEGKTRSSQNARKHGLTARKSIVVAPEEEDEYLRYYEAMFAKLDPDDELQATLAEIVVQSAWRLRLFVDVEADFMRENLEKGARLNHAFTWHGMHDRFAILSRYQVNIERTMYKALDDLRQMKREATPTS